MAGARRIVIAALPPLAVLVQIGRGRQLLNHWARSGEVEARAAFLDRELDSVADVSRRLGRAGDAASIASAMLDRAFSLVGVNVAAVVLLNETGDVIEGKEIIARGEPAELSSLRGSPEIRRAVAVREPVVAERAAFIPLVAAERWSGFSWSRRPPKSPRDELTLLQALAGEGRSRSTVSARPRSSQRRSSASGSSPGSRARCGRELDLDAVLEVAVSETGRALDVSRCFIRLGLTGDEMSIGAEWDADGIAPVRRFAGRLPGTNLALRRRETVAIGDVLTAPELEDPSLGGREVLLEVGARAVLAMPIAVFDQVIGIFTLHRAEAGPWPAEEIKLAEAVAREVGLAMHAARLLRESEIRLDHLSTLIKAAQVVSAELRLDTVLQRLVAEVRKLLDADAADCYLHDADRGVIRCVAVHGLDESLVGFEAPRERGLAGVAFRERRSVVSHDYREIADDFPNPVYESFKSALVAPMIVGGEVLGVLGVGSRDPGRRFERADREAIEAFAGLATLAIQHAASFEERDRRSRIERGFFLVASALAQPLSLDETVDAVAQAASEALGGSFGAVLMPDGDGLRLAGRYELPEDILGTISALPPSLADCSARGLVVAAPDARTDTRLDDAWHSAAQERFRSLLAIPLDAEGGVAVVFFAHDRSFSDDDLALAGHLADAAKGALERGALFERERSARRLSQHLARIGTFLATELDPSRVVEEVAAEAPELLGADVGAIRLVEGDELVLRAASADAGEEHAGTRSPVAAGLAGDVVQFRTPLRVADVDVRTAVDPDPLLAGHRSYLGVPLTGAEGGLLGVLSVYSRGVRDWRDDEVEALVALAGNASTALSTAELYQRVAVEKERSETILAHVADGIVAVDRDGKVVLWNEAATRITGIDRGRRPRARPRRGAEALAGRSGERGRRNAHPRHPARRRGGLALAERGRDARSQRRDRGADLHLPGHLRPAAGRADEVGIRLYRLAPAARAPHVHLRLRRDASPPRRQLQRRGAAHLPPVRRLGV